MTIEQIKASGNIVIKIEDGYMVTKFGKSTYNYWNYLGGGEWLNYDCKTKY